MLGNGTSKAIKEMGFSIRFVGCFSWLATSQGSLFLPLYRVMSGRRKEKIGISEKRDVRKEGRDPKRVLKKLIRHLK